ncbi:siderophore-interacting protein [Caldimonas tepidiphila]|uniref:siderophore-interacting protein n=1 Tax=Caldimonas tepidiphila TaxID=2315841 RepID=UPI00147408D4|nr:siderophore-interacting protein [Caldimonas tepidiphila]
MSRREEVSANFVRVVLACDDLRDFQSLSFDDHVKLALPGPGADAVLRDFTPVDIDPARAELAIEFALHDDGVASRWARTAAPGAAIAVLGPRGSMVVPMDYDWHLLAGDASALPAISRRLRELPSGTKAIVLVHVPSPDDERRLSTRADAHLVWANSDAQWLSQLRSMPLPPGEGFIWCAGESQVMKAARAICLEEHKHPRHALRIASYWKQGVPGFHERLDPQP